MVGAGGHNQQLFQHQCAHGAGLGHAAQLEFVREWYFGWHESDSRRVDRQRDRRALWRVGSGQCSQTLHPPTRMSRSSLEMRSFSIGTSAASAWTWTSAQQQFADEFFSLHQGLQQRTARISVVVVVVAVAAAVVAAVAVVVVVVAAAFVGWRVSVFSFEGGGQTFLIGPRGAMIAGGHARVRFALRVCDHAS